MQTSEQKELQQGTSLSYWPYTGCFSAGLYDASFNRNFCGQRVAYQALMHRDHVFAGNVPLSRHQGDAANASADATARRRFRMYSSWTASDWTFPTGKGAFICMSMSCLKACASKSIPVHISDIVNAAMSAMLFFRRQACL